MGCKFYITDWIPQLGRYAIITSVFRKLDSYTYIAETFVFSLDGDALEGETPFARKRFTYDANPKKMKAEEIRYPVDNVYMHKVALHEAKNIISQEKTKAYKKTKDREIYRQQWKLGECEPWPNFALELGNKYQNELGELAKDSGDEDLKYTLSALLLTLAGIGPFEQNNS